MIIYSFDEASKEIYFKYLCKNFESKKFEFSFAYLCE